MSNLPRTELCDLPEEERAVAEALIATLGDDLAALAWQGSWARGEANAESDHDMVVVMRRLDDDLICRIAAVFRGRDAHWSTFIKTEEELRQYPAHGRFQFRYGISLLYGDFEQPAVARENVIAEIRNLANEIEHEARYRLVHRDLATRDPRDIARDGRILHYWAKLGLLAMKARELLHEREYPVTRASLRECLTDADEIALLDTVDHWPELKAEYERDFTPLAVLLERVVRKLVAELPAE